MCDCYSKETVKVLDKVQEFITNLSSFTDGENQRLSEEVSTNKVNLNCQGRFTVILKMLIFFMFLNKSLPYIYEVIDI